MYHRQCITFVSPHANGAVLSPIINFIELHTFFWLSGNDYTVFDTAIWYFYLGRCLVEKASWGCVRCIRANGDQKQTCRLD